MHFKPSKLINFLIYCFFIFSVCFLIYLARADLTVYIIGILIAYIFYPLVLRIEGIFLKLGLNQKPSRVASIVVLFAILVGSVSLFVLNLGQIVFDQFNILLLEVGNLVDIKTLFGEISDWDFDKITQAPPQELAKEAFTEYGQHAGTVVESIWQFLFSTVSTIFSLGFSLFLLPFWMFYLMYNPKSIKNGFLKLFPTAIRQDILVLGRIVNSIFTNYIRGQIILSFIVGLAVYIGLILIGMPNALALALIAGITEAIPIFGPFIAWMAMLIGAISSGWEMMLSVSILSILVQQVEGNFLVPKVQGDSVNFPAWLVMLTITIGGALFGLIGMIMALPLAAVASKIFYYLNLRLSKKNLTPEEVSQKVKNSSLRFDEF
jgi:predicted PurR-regulated permease PerM